MADVDLAFGHQHVDAAGSVQDNHRPHVKVIFQDHVARHEVRASEAEPAVLVGGPSDIRAIDTQCNKFADLTNATDSSVVSGWRLAVGSAHAIASSPTKHCRVL